jgi:alkylation response protein AidB-like acyl-CoA dehydrogenase
MLSFELSEDQAMLQETVRKFAVDELRAKLREYEKARGVPDDLRRRFHELGLLLVDVPEAAGGMGMGTLTAVVAHEELAYGDPGAALALWNVSSLPAAVLELGTPEQASKLLARFGAADGWKKRGALAWTDAGKGKALPEVGFATTARKEGDGWVLDGEKAFVVNGGVADLYIVFAQVDATAGWKGIAAFAVEGANPGVAAGARSEWLGLETAHAGSVKLTACRVGDDARLAGAADPVLAARRLFARIGIVNAARQVGLARASYELALSYTQERIAFGKPVAHFQAISFTLAEMAMEVEAARWMVWRAAVDFDRGAKGALVAAAMASTQANELAWRIADNGVQLLGGAGFVQDYPAEKWMRDSKALALCGPPDQLNQLTVAAEALGKPEEFGVMLPVSYLQPVVS